MKERDVNFFRPVWRRVAVTAVCAIWAGLELFGHDSTWIAITIGLTAYSVWQFFIAFPKDLPVADTAASVANPGEPESAGEPAAAEIRETADVPPQA